MNECEFCYKFDGEHTEDCPVDCVTRCAGCKKRGVCRGDVSGTGIDARDLPILDYVSLGYAYDFFCWRCEQSYREGAEDAGANWEECR